MLIIIDGPDGSGKSTLAKDFQKKTGFEIVHRSKPETQEEKDRMLEEYMAMGDKDLILDRSWYSEMVYGEVMRDESYISIYDMYKIESTITNGVIIHCTDDVNKLWERCQSRGEDYIKSYDKLKLIKYKFENIMHSKPHALQVVRYTIGEDFIV